MKNCDNLYYYRFVYFGTFHFSSFFSPELPKPSLGDLSDLRTLSSKIRRERAPNLLSLNFTQLQKLDSVTVNLVPEKKGLLLKHVEYEVKSDVSIPTTQIVPII